MVYAAGGDGEVARFDGGIIVRAPRWWLDRSAPRGITEIARADTNRANAGGGTVGPMLMLVQRDPRTAWLDDRRVHLGADNILLVRVANDGVLQVVGSTDVDPSLPLPDVSCAAQQERHHHFDAALEAVVARSPAVREFMR